MQSKQDIPVVILAGGKGMRLREYTEIMPKGLVPIGNIPVMLHVMMVYAYQGFNRFILCLGYKGEMIKEYFMDHEWLTNDFKLKMGTTKGKEVINLSEKLNEFEITFCDTGLDTQTGGRIKKIEKYVDTENFLANYCDGLADINLQSLLNHHFKMGRVATLTGVNPMSPFGILEVKDGLAISFKEKPKLPGIINGGYFIFNKKIFDYLDENSILEEEPLRKLASEGQLAVYQHSGFWTSLDTYKDFDRLNSLWETGRMIHMGIEFQKPPWKIWD